MSEDKSKPDVGFKHFKVVITNSKGETRTISSFLSKPGRNVWEWYASLHDRLVEKHEDIKHMLTLKAEDENPSGVPVGLPDVEHIQVTTGQDGKPALKWK